VKIKRNPPPVKLEANKDLPELARATSLALGVLRHAKVHSWSELGPTMPFGLELTQGQYDLMVAHAQYLGQGSGQGIKALIIYPSTYTPGLGTACMVAMFVPTAAVSHRRRALPDVPSSFPASLRRDGIGLGCG